MFQVTAIGQALYYAKALKKGAVYTVLGHEIIVRSSIGFLLFCAIGLLFSLCMSSFMIYFSRTGILRLAKRYEILCSRRILAVIGARTRLGPPLPGSGYHWSDAEILKLAGTHARLCGRVFRMILNSIVPAMSFVISILALFYIDMQHCQCLLCSFS